MRPIGTRVVIKQHLKRKTESSIILPDNMKGEDNKFNYEVEHSIISLGKNCPKDELKEKDIIYLNPYSQPLMMLNVKGDINKNDTEIVNELIVEYHDIVGKE